MNTPAIEPDLGAGRERDEELELEEDDFDFGAAYGFLRFGAPLVVGGAILSVLTEPRLLLAVMLP